MKTQIKKLSNTPKPYQYTAEDVCKIMNLFIEANYGENAGKFESSFINIATDGNLEVSGFANPQLSRGVFALLFTLDAECNENFIYTNLSRDLKIILHDGKTWNDAYSEVYKALCS